MWLLFWRLNFVLVWPYGNLATLTVNELTINEVNFLVSCVVFAVIPTICQL